MATKKKIKPKKKNTVEDGLLALAAGKQAEMDKERAEFEKKNPPFKRKLLVSDENSLNATAHAIGEYVGVFEISAHHVEQIKEYISTGQLSFSKKDGLVFSLRRAVQMSEGSFRKDFKMSEMSDGTMENLEVDGFEVGMMLTQGRAMEISSDQIRRIAAGAVELPVELIGKMSTKDILSIYGLYVLFFLGR